MELTSNRLSKVTSVRCQVERIDLSIELVSDSLIFFFFWCHFHHFPLKQRGETFKHSSVSCSWLLHFILRCGHLVFSGLSLERVEKYVPALSFCLGCMHY